MARKTNTTKTNITKMTKAPSAKMKAVNELDELKEQYQKMIEDRDKKCDAAKKQLIEMLEITVDKYRTATGTAEALRVLRFVYGDDYTDIYQANELAFTMAKVTDDMRKKAESLGCAEMDQLCDGFYEKQLDLEPYDYDESEMKLAEEMMRIDLCRNVGSGAEDMVGFIDRTQEELNAITEKIDELESKAKEDN